MKRWTHVDTSSYAKEVDMISPKLNVNKSHVVKLQTISTKLDKLNPDKDKLVAVKLKTVPANIKQTYWYCRKTSCQKKNLQYINLKDIIRKYDDIVSMTYNKWAYQSMAIWYR